MCCCPEICLLGLGTPRHSAGGSGGVLLFEHAGEIGAAGAGVQFFVGGGSFLCFGFDVVGFSAASLGAPFGEESAKGQIFFRGNTVALDEGVVGCGSL